MSPLIESAPQIRSRKKIELFPKQLIKNLEVLTLEPLNGINRKIILIEDSMGKRASVFVYSNASPKREGQAFIFPSFQKHTHIGRIQFLNQTELFDQVDKEARERVNSMSNISDKTGIKLEPNILVGSMTAIVVPDSEDPRSILDTSLQRAVGFLFSENGPLNNTLVIPDTDFYEQGLRMVEGGAQLLIDREGFDILTDEALSLIPDLLKKIKSIPSFLVAISAYLRKDLDVFKNNMEGPRKLDEERRDYIKRRSNFYLNKLLISLTTQ